MSFLSRMGVEMGNAILDAYGNIVHGDDAGKSAKLVFVTRPRPVHWNNNQSPTNKGGGGGGGASIAGNVNGAENNLGGGGGTANAVSAGSVVGMFGGGGGGGGGMIVDNDNNGTGNPHSKKKKKTKTEITVVTSSPPLSPTHQVGAHMQHNPITNPAPDFDLGMTFIEVNNRAYVKTVIPDSDAALAGVQPRDAVQFAFVHTDVKITPNVTAKDQDEKAAEYALDCEKKGQRTTFADFVDMFPFDITRSPYQHPNNGGMLGDNGMISGSGSVVARRDGTNGGGGGGAGEDFFDGTMMGGTAGGGPGGPNHGASGVGGMNANRRLSHHDSSGLSGSRQYHRQSSIHSRPSDGSLETQLSDMKRLVREEGVTIGTKPRIMPRNDRGEPSPYPVTIVFRRTRQRKQLVGGGTPHLFIPNFRLDDECDRAATLVRKLAPTADMPPQPDAWDELVHDGTEWLFPDGSIMPGPESTENGLVGAAVHARQQQQQQQKNRRRGNHHANGGGGGDGDSGQQPLKRVNSAEFDDVKTGEDTIPQDSWEAKSTAKIEAVRQRMAEEAKLRKQAKAAKKNAAGGAASLSGGSVGPSSGAITEDVEAATIRGMIQKAVGLAFVRTSKVVLGVSLHCGSGIVIGRLPDGTWSAPSAIGTWGLGLGLQFGLEVADYIFILQTQDCLAHFKTGGHFTIGGNMGAAVAGLGREAYGAASLKGSLCNGESYAQDDDTTVAASSVTGGTGIGGGRRASLQGGGLDDGSTIKSSKDVASASEIAPIVAYGKSQGLYFGVSLEGSRIFVRDDINARAYKFATGKTVSAKDILSGKISTPPEAEDLYASLHSVEFAHELSVLPRPPEILRGDSPNDWKFDRSTLHESAAERRGVARGPAATAAGGGSNAAQTSPFSFFSLISDADTEECADFETKFKKFLYGGVSVLRLVPHAEPTGGKTRRERRTLWLMLPEVGSLRLGFISKQNDGGDGGEGIKNSSPSRKGRAGVPNRTPTGRRNRRGGGWDDYSAAPTADDFTEGNGSVYSHVTEDFTEYSDYMSVGDDTATQFTQGDASTAIPKRAEANVGTGAATNFRHGKVNLSEKYCMALTEVTCLSQEPKVSIRFSPEDATEHLRVISIQDYRGNSLLFLANNFREAELLMCGLKLLLERETARLGMRGGAPISHLRDSKGGGGGISPSGAQIAGSRFPVRMDKGYPNGQSASDVDEGLLISGTESDAKSKAGSPHSTEKVPEGRPSWSNVPGRDFLRGQASGSMSQDGEERVEVVTPAAVRINESRDEVPKYVFGELIIREVASRVPMSLPLPLCRALLLDSSSPVITKWESERGDRNYQKTPWTFPPGTPREHERYSTEHQLIASGSMMGAYRTSSFDRLRNGQLVSLTETHIVDADDEEKLSFTVTERTPRRGFSLKVRILLRAASRRECEATILGEVRPMGKNMTNQSAVHKAFCLVLNEITMRYGTEGRGLLRSFLGAINENPIPPSPSRSVSSGQGQQQQHGFDKHHNPEMFDPSSHPKGYFQPAETYVPIPHQQFQHMDARSTEPLPRQHQSFQRMAPAMTVDVLPQNLPPAYQHPTPSPSSIDLESGRPMVRQDPPPPAVHPPSPGATQQTNQNSMSFEEVLNSRNRGPVNRVVGPMEESMPSPLGNHQGGGSSEFVDIPLTGEIPSPHGEESKPVTIEVKPLPKIRLSLMPAPREEDEDNASNSTGSPTFRSKSKKGNRGASSRDRRRASRRRANGKRQ